MSDAKSAKKTADKPAHPAYTAMIKTAVAGGSGKYLKITIIQSYCDMSQCHDVY